MPRILRKDSLEGIYHIINLINALGLFTGNWSPHGSYDPTKYDEFKNIIRYKK